jgi:hypothetical protein
MDTTIRKVVITFFLLWSGNGYCQQAQEPFLLGNKAYEKTEFDQALHHYQAIKKKGPAVWYNMGNCYFHTNDFVRAIICWQRSLHGATAALYKDAQCNCAYTYQQLKMAIEPAFFDKIVNQAYAIPTLLIQILFLLSWFFLWFVMTRRSKVLSVQIMIGITILCIVYLGYITWHRYQQQWQEYGIVTHETPLYAGPHVHYDTLATVEKAQKLLLIQKRPEWYKVAKDNDVGWIPSNTLEIINHQS